MTLLLAVVLLFGQGDNTSAVRRDLVLQGMVTDETNALLPGAVVVIESETPQTETSYSFRARTKDGAHQVNLEVRGSSGQASRVVLTDTWTLPKN